jgi:polysaccharide biosynthesis transport protein
MPGGTVERDDAISLQDHLTVLRRRRWMIVGTIVAVVVAALGASFAQTPVYEAETEIVVEPVRRTQDVTVEELLAPAANAVQTERLIVTSRPVAERVAADLGIPDLREVTEDVRVQTVPDTRVVRIIAADTDPAAAAARTDAFANAYLDYKRDEAVEGLLAARSNLDARAIDLRAAIEELDAEEGAEAAQRDALLAQLAQVSAQLADLGESTQAVTGGGSVLTPAEVPTSPVSPRPLRTGALAVVLGLLLGVGLAFLRDHFDDVVRDENDFKRATSGRPVLGRIPTWSDPEGGDRLATVVDPTALASEAYRELSSGVRFMLAALDDTVPTSAPVPDPSTPFGVRSAEPEPEQPEGRAIVMASAAAGDGKTSTAANLAVAAARTGLTVLLVDADMRRSTVGKRFGLGRTSGLSDLLAGKGDIADHVVPVGVDGLFVLPSGTTPPNPHELLASAAMRAFEKRVRASVDLIIYDTPAVLAVPDALELGRHADLAILVGRAETSSRRQLGAAIERLQQVGTDISGTVLNDISGGADAYYYAYYYADSDTRVGGNGRPGKALSPRSQRKAEKAAARQATAARTGDGSRAGDRARARKERAKPARSSRKASGPEQPKDLSPSATSGVRTVHPKERASRGPSPTENAPEVEDLFGDRHR